VAAVVNNPSRNNASQSAHTPSNSDACPQQPPDHHRATTGRWVALALRVGIGGLPGWSDTSVPGAGHTGPRLMFRLR
jgi:hypothetical protein